MSKRTTGVSPSSAWRWVPTPAVRARRATATRTASWAASACVLLAIAAGCGRHAASRDYEAAAQAFLRGEVAEAASEAARQAARYAGRDPETHWKFRLLQAEALTVLARSDEAAALLAQKPPAALDQLEARRLIDLAALRVGRTKEANEMLAQARALARDPELRVRLHLVQGQVALRAQGATAGEGEFHAARESAERIGRKDLEALALNNLCYVRKQQNRHEEAVDFCLRAIRLAEAAGARRAGAMAHTNVGSVYAYLGDFPAAFEHQQKAVDAQRAMKARMSVMIGLGELGLTYDRSGESEKAIPLYREAYDLATELKAVRDAGRHAENMALVYIKLRRWDEAAEWNRRAAETDPAGASLAYLVRNRASIALGRGDNAEASRLARELLAHKDAPAHLRWEAWAMLGEIDAGARRYTAANANFERALAIIEDTRNDLGGAQNRVTLLSRLISFHQQYVDTAVAQNDDARALRIAESSRARVLAERLGRAVTPSATPPRAPNAWVLSFWVAPKRSFAWLLGPAGVRRFELPPAGELESLVTAYRNVVEHSVADPLADASARSLWEKLAPALAGIPKGARVIVVPDGPLHRLNLETLAVPSSPPHYWIEDVELAVSPSISIATAKGDAALRGAPALIIGAPEYQGSGYEPLPGAAAEVAQLRSRFSNAAALTGAQATPAAYRAAGPEKFSVIHFAAHAEANMERPLESAVVLSRSADGFKLHARDVIDVPIRAELVTLAACRSAGARAYAGEGLMGFAWAFLHAGAKAVVAGLWDVSDHSSGPLMQKFYEGVAAGRGTSCSLRDAKLALLREGRFRKAFYWGPFQAYVAGAY